MPYISQNFINDLPNQIDIVDLIAKRIILKKTGDGYRGPCPFHGGKNLNFSVNAQEQFYHCFKCGESGGAINFVQKHDNLNFVEAIEAIADEFGLTIEYDKSNKSADPKFDRYRDLSQKVSDFYKQQLKTSPAKKKAVSYAQIRGISGEIAKRFELGFATPSNNDLALNFEKIEQSVTDLKALGLIKIGKYGDYDFFRDRLIFPIHNNKGNIIAFGGRAFDNIAKAKYLNSQESPIFSKSRELYGLYHARKYSHKMDCILVVEGYMDVVALHQAGFTKVVATLGTATTAEHLQTLSHTTDTIVFCFDGDAAGRMAAWRALKIALPVVKSGLLIKFLFLPDGEDPDTLIKKESIKVFEERISKAKMLSKFLFDHIKVKVDFNTIEGKTLFLEEVSALISLVTYEAYQEQLLEGVSQVVGQSIEQIKDIFVKQVKKVQTQQVQVQEVQAPPNIKYDGVTAPSTNDSYDNHHESTSMPQENNSAKVLMGKMIGLLLNYPLLVDENGIAEERIRKIKNSDVLLKLVREVEVEENITKEILINLFKSKPAIQQRLQKLSELEIRWSEVEARNQFLDTLLSVEEKQKEINGRSITNEVEYTKNLKARKGKKN